MSASPLIPAPGAKAAKVCGILAIVFALTCVGIPVAVVLGIVALVQHGKAKRLAKAQPEAYEAVPSTGLVTGIIGLVLPVFMLPFAGIVSAIAIPALLSQRGRARDKAVIDTLQGTTVDLVAEYDRQVEARTPLEAIPAAMESRLKTVGAETHNPWNLGGPAFESQLTRADGFDQATVALMAQNRAVETGVVVYVIALPDPAVHRDGWLTGAVRLKEPVNGHRVMTKTVALN